MNHTLRAAAESTAPDIPNDRQSLLAAVSEDEAGSYSAEDAVLYALGVGFGSDPAEVGELGYAYRQPLLKTVPAFATMLPKCPFPTAARNWDARSALPVEQKLELFRPLPADASLLANRRVLDATGIRGRRPARIVVQSEVRLASDETALFTLSSAMMPVSSPAFGHGLPPAVAGYTVPKREPDLSCDIHTRADQSLLFCLTGDDAPLHADRKAARDAGLGSIVLQTRCVLGIACRAILRTICDYDYTLISAMEARFPAPAFPGDIVTTDMWQERNIVSFRCTVRARRNIVLDGGRCTLSS